MMVNATRKTEQRSPSISSKRDSEYRHLLSPSVAPSRTESIRSFATNSELGDQDAIAPLPAAGKQRALSEPNVKRPYRGYPSEDDYIKAFTEFLMEKQYYETDTQLTGFYGKETMDDYIKKGGHGPFSKSRADRKREKERRKRDAVGTTLENVTEVEEERAKTEGNVDGTLRTVDGEVREAPRGLRKMGKIGRVFTRRGTVA